MSQNEKIATKSRSGLAVAPNDLNTLKRVAGALRLILHTDSIKRSDIVTFRNAASVLAGEYNSLYKNHNQKVITKKVYSGREIVSTINGFPQRSIVSLDIISHGNQGGIHIARKLATPIKSGRLQKRWHVALRKHERPQTPADAEYMEESMHGLYSGRIARRAVSYFFNQTFQCMEDGDRGDLIPNDDTAFLRQIEFGRFADAAFVEFHGCRTAEHIRGINFLADNFAENFSEKLPS